MPYISHVRAKARFDIHQNVTDRIVAAMEAGAGEWQMPWRVGTGGRRPVNVASGNAYRGINTLALWVDAQAFGYASHLWGTYRQWAERGCQVRKGAKASMVVFYKEIPLAGDSEGADDDAPDTRLFARTTPVFNADQVDGDTAPEDAAPSLGTAEVLAGVEAFVGRTGADIRHGGTQACYVPKLDQVHMPARAAFRASPTSSATETYYSTLLHELTHWTKTEARCHRDLAKRFGSEAYAMEELVAELGAAFLCADLGIAGEPRADHAQYLAHWLRVLKDDKKAVFTAAAKASQAATFLTDLAAP